MGDATEQEGVLRTDDVYARPRVCGRTAPCMCDRGTVVRVVLFLYRSPGASCPGLRRAVTRGPLSVCVTAVRITWYPR